MEGMRYGTPTPSLFLRLSPGLRQLQTSFCLVSSRVSKQKK